MFDGASRGNPGPAATGYVIYWADQELERGGRYLGPAPHTNNQAEYHALLHGLTRVAEIVRGVGWTARIHIQGDSKLVLEQIKGAWDVKSAPLVELHTKIKALMESRFADTTFTFEHLKRHLNTVADAAANAALDAGLRADTGASATTSEI